MPVGTLKRTKKRREEVARLHTSGATTREMAAYLGVGKATIYHYLHELGLEPHIKMTGCKPNYDNMTLPLCEECTYEDCVWNPTKAQCPMQRRRKKEKD